MKTWIAVLMALWIGLECGYRIRANGEGRRLDVAYQGGFESCQEQF